MKPLPIIPESEEQKKVRQREKLHRVHDYLSYNFPNKPGEKFGNEFYTSLTMDNDGIEGLIKINFGHPNCKYLDEEMVGMLGDDLENIIKTYIWIHKHNNK
jgi:hypothetical protein